MAAPNQRNASRYMRSAASALHLLDGTARQSNTRPAPTAHVTITDFAPVFFFNVRLGFVAPFV